MNEWSGFGKKRQDSRNRRGLSRQGVAREIRIPTTTLKARGKTTSPVSIFLGDDVSPQALIVEDDE